MGISQGYPVGAQGYPGVPNGSTWSKSTINLPDKVVGFEIFKIAQQTKKLASKVPKWASPRAGYPVGA